MSKKNIFISMFLIVFFVLVFTIFQNLSFIFNLFMNILNLFFPFILGLAIAFVLNVPMTLIEKKLSKKFKKTRTLSIILTILLVVLIVSFVIILVVPDFIKAITTFLNTLPNTINNLSNYLNDLSLKYPTIKDEIESVNWQSITDGIINFIKNSLDILISNSINFISSIISSIISFVMSIVFSIYILSEKEILANQVKKIMKAYLPDNINSKIINILNTANITFTKFITGQCTEALILGFMFLVSLTIFRFPYALAISSLITVTALIPIFGALFASIIGFILIAVTSPIKAIWFFILFQILQQIENNLIYPKVVGKSVGLPSLWVMLAVLIGGNAFGLAGMLLSVPISSMLYSVLKLKVNERTRNEC